MMDDELVPLQVDESNCRLPPKRGEGFKGLKLAHLTPNCGIVEKETWSSTTVAATICP